MPNNNEPVKSGANAALNRFKTEVATELGIANYDQLDKGNLSSRQNGYVGGNMTKKMVAYAQEALKQGMDSSIGNSAITEYPKQ
ncbi:MAG: small, acid-soluble spore protein, alpha/beta type [Bacillota bacterium]|jgi:small acid-soluble spore protein A (major alpha-type SASP)